MPLGIPQVDEILNGGLRPKEFTILAARPGMGKSQLMNAVAYEIAMSAIKSATKESIENQENFPIAIFSAEMSKEAEVKRFLAMHSNVSLGRVVSKRLSESDGNAINNGLAELAELPIFIDDTAGTSLTIGSITSKCNRLKQKYGGIRMIMVDYLQLLGQRDSNQRSGEVGAFSAGFLNLAKTLECHVFALAQLSRGPEGRTDKRPMLSDLGESGKLEQDANTVIFIYREDYYAKERSEDEVPMELIFAKNRNGSTDTVKVFFNKPTGRIRGDRPSQTY
jgi:replicative DNA helicase